MTERELEKQRGRVTVRSSAERRREEKGKIGAGGNGGRKRIQVR